MIIEPLAGLQVGLCALSAYQCAPDGIEIIENRATGIEERKLCAMWDSIYIFLDIGIS